MNPPALSLCMITRNESARIQTCLDSVQSLGPELIVVDTGSTDTTLEIAARYGARSESRDFTFVDFSAARNHALALANGRWILVLDADERLDPASVPLIHDLVRRGDNAGYYFERMNYADGRKAPTIDHVVRLFPNRAEYRYRGRVHETIDASILNGGGLLVPTQIQIHHEFASDPESRRNRNHWYIGILNEEIAANPSQLVASGWGRKQSMEALAPGTEVTLTIAPSRAGGQVGLIQKITDSKGGGRDPSHARWWGVTYDY